MTTREPGIGTGTRSGRAGTPLPAAAPPTQNGAHGVTRPTSRVIGIPLCLGISAMLLAAGVSALAQYAINWHTIDGGGGTSTGGVYAVSGTIGQPDAGPTLTNGQYALTGGFWALPQAVQTEGAPTLTITSAGPGQAQLAWPPASTNWVLQESLALSPAAWTNSPTGATNPIIVPATLPAKFYRLFKP